LSNEIGKRISEAREARKFTRKALAEKIGATPSLVSNYENGDRIPSVQNLVAIARTLATSADYLLCLNEEPDLKGDEDLRQLVLEIQNLGTRDRDVVTAVVKALRGLASREGQ
jgi:transcriptional regulator with XRE-family HTH domain